LRTLFPPADGDRVQVPLPDASIDLLPVEWSELVEKKRKWGWWGYNKDRVQVAISKEGGEASEGAAAAEPLPKAKARQVAKKGVGRGGGGEAKQEQGKPQEQGKAQEASGARKRGAAAKESKEGKPPAQTADAAGTGERGTKRARATPSKQSEDAAVGDVAEPAQSEEVTRLMEQMRGVENGFYLGCPVEVKLAGASSFLCAC